MWGRAKKGSAGTAQVGLCWGPLPSRADGLHHSFGSARAWQALLPQTPGPVGSGGAEALGDGQVPRPRANRAHLWSQATPRASRRPEGGISPAAPRSWGSQGELTRGGEGGAHHPHGPQKPPAVKSIHRSLGVQFPSPTVTCSCLDLAGPARYAPEVGFWGEGGCSWLTADI